MKNAQMGWVDYLQLFSDKLKDLQDYQEAKQARDEFIASGEKDVDFDDVFRNVK